MDTENAPLDAMTSHFSSIYGTLIGLDEFNRGWRYFWANNELRYRKCERDPDCPPNTYRTDIPRKLPTKKLNFKNDKKRRGKKSV